MKCVNVVVVMLVIGGLILVLVWVQVVDFKLWQLNMGKGVIQILCLVWELNNLLLIICMVIGVIVFGVMVYVIFKFCKFKGVVVVIFSYNIKVEIIWMVILVIILVVMVWLVMVNLIKMYDICDVEMMVKVIGYQWMWKYEYFGENVIFISCLDCEFDCVWQSGIVLICESYLYYLLDVDNWLVLLVDIKVCFVIIFDDVIYVWWVLVLGWKQDVIFGFINEVWISIEQFGVYCGQCVELCGKDYGFMLIVVEVVFKEDFKQWLVQCKFVLLVEFVFFVVFVELVVFVGEVLVVLVVVEVGSVFVVVVSGV